MGRVWPDVLRFYQIQSETAEVAVGAILADHTGDQ
jgi:hypothetical protein